MPPVQFYRNVANPPPYHGWGSDFTHPFAGNGFLFNISEERLLDTVGFGACIPSLERANVPAAWEPALVSQTRLRPRRLRAVSRTGAQR